MNRSVCTGLRNTFSGSIAIYFKNAISPQIVSSHSCRIAFNRKILFFHACNWVKRIHFVRKKQLKNLLTVKSVFPDNYVNADQNHVNLCFQVHLEHKKKVSLPRAHCTPFCEKFKSSCGQMHNFVTSLNLYFRSQSVHDLYHV